MRFKVFATACAAAVVVLAAVGFFTAGSACAHDPRFACSPRSQTSAVRIADPQKSWAFYGHLQQGQADVYTFATPTDLAIPWNLLVDVRDARNPARPEARLFDAGGGVVARSASLSKHFFEPFSRESYVTSEEQTLHLHPGQYSLVVSMRGGDMPQRYTLAIGRDERFSLLEIPYVAGAIVRIRRLSY